MVRLNDQLSQPLGGLQNTLKKFAAALGLAKLVKEFVDSTSEAQAALAQLNIAFRNSAESANRSKEDILAFSDSVLKFSTFTDESATRAQSTLLRFSRVSGDVFVRARKDILDVASALDTDLESAAQIVGRALQAPEQGLRQLRAAGIIFTESQRKLITSLVDSGNAAEAQQIILQRLEDTFGGASDAARNTFGGAIRALKNNLLELFEGTDKGASVAAEGLNALTDVISDPEFKQNIQTFTSELLEWAAAFLDLTGKAVKGWQLITQQVAKGIDALVPNTEFEDALSKRFELIDKLQRAQAKVPVMVAQGVSRGFAEQEVNLEGLKKELAAVNDQIKSMEQAPGTGRVGENWIRAGRIGGHQATPPGSVTFISDEQRKQQEEDAKAAQDAMDKALASLEQVRVSESLLKDPLIEWEKQTRTSAEKVQAEFTDFETSLEQLVGAGKISVEESNKRFNEQMDDVLKPIQISVSRLKVPLTAAQEAAKQFSDTLAEGLQNAARQGELSGKSILRNLLAAFESKILFNAIDKLSNYIGSSLSKAASGSGGWASLANLLVGAFGGSSADSLQPVTTTVSKIPVHAAGGGSMSGMRVVGEDGPELESNGGQVMNRRQLAFAMAGAGTTINMGDTNIRIDGSGSPEQTAALIEVRIQQNNRQQADALNRRLKSNGFGDLR